MPTIDVACAADAGSWDLAFETIAEHAIAKTVDIAQLSSPSESELSILIAGDETLRELNRKWRDKDRPTNVLSFPGEPNGALLGDIVVSMDTTCREASLENKSLHDHFSHLIVHGFLHLFGYDHETEEDALQMERLESRILAELGIADPHENLSTS